MKKKTMQVGMALAAGLWLAGFCGAQTIGEHGFYENQTAVYATQNEDLGEYIVGDQGDNNLLVVSNEVRVTSNYMVIGGDGGDHNTLLVTDGASFGHHTSWYLWVGSNSSHNALVVQEGATMRVVQELPLGWTADAHSNSVLVTGAGSVLTNRRMSVGWDGSYNHLTVSDGGRVENVQWSFVGRQAGSSHNQATVTGEDSLWQLGDYFRVGDGANANSNLLTVTEGGRVTVGTDWEIGSGTGASYNEALVSAGGSVSNAGLLYIGSGTGDGGNRLEVTGAGSRVESVAEADQGAREFRVGFSSPDNEVLVADGGQLFFHDVTGTNRLETYIGRNATGQRNLLRVESGGIVSNDYGYSLFRLGHNAGSDNNRVEVDGDGSQLYGSLRIGNSSTGNVVRVTDGGRIEGASGNFLGVNNGATGNRLEIDGDGSRVDLDELRLGHNAGADDNVVRITDGGQLWLTDRFDVGASAGGNRVEIDGAGSQAVLANALYLGLGSASDSNVLHLSNGARLEIMDTTRIGSGGNYNQALVEGGATVQSLNVRVGFGADTRHNELTITGDGTAWTNAATFYVSAAGAEGNILRIQDGALLDSQSVTVGANGTAELSNATLRVSGSLEIEDGGTLRGSGLIENTGTADVDGLLSPGFSIGEMEFTGALTLGENAEVLMEIAGLNDFDQIVAGGALTYGGTLKLVLLDGYDPQLNDSFPLFVADSYLDIGEITINSDDAVLSDPTWSWSLQNDGHVSVIPEPGTVSLLFLSAATVWMLRRRRA